MLSREKDSSSRTTQWLCTWVNANRTILRVPSVIGKTISSPALVCESATNPPLLFLAISSSHLSWIIKVYASNNSFATVEDSKELHVFHAKVDALHAAPLLLLVDADAALPSVALLVCTGGASLISRSLDPWNTLNSEGVGLVRSGQ